MVYIFLGVIGFVNMLLFDLFSLKEKSSLKYFYGVSGILLVLFSSFSLGLIYSTLIIPTTFRIIGGLLLVVSLFLLYYSVFHEVGKNTYALDAKPKLVTSGTYSLSRHPGVIWLFFVYLFGFISFANFYLLLAGIVWTITNIVYVYIQERLIFHHLFEGYKEYQMSTPMIIPNSNSLRKFFTSTNWRK